MKKYYIIVLVLLAAFSETSLAQSSKIKPQLKMAEKEYNNLRFLSAVKYLQPVLSIDSGNVRAQELMAYSQRNLRNYDEALYWFAKLSQQSNMKTLWALHYAEALANKEQYELAENWYRKYLKLVPGDKRATSFVKAGAFSMEDNAEWKVSKTKLNTVAAEYSPLYYKKGLIFTSNRLESKLMKPVFGWDQTPYSNLYYVDSLEAIAAGSSASSPAAKKNPQYVFNDDDTSPTSNDSKTLGELNNTWLKNVMADENSGLTILPVPGKVNSKFNEGAAVLLPEGSLMFTRNNYQSGNVGKSENGTIKLKLYTASGPDWSKIEAFPYNDDEYSVGHPAISKDGNVLIFASDKPGGFGGTDLYYSVRSGEGRFWGKPVNMGPKINTEGNELFPSFANDGILLFSSTGYAGFGGLDIFEVTLKDLKPTGVPKNLGAPINSFGDDFGMIRSADGKSGYFSSNRDGSDDIFEYKRQNYHVKLEGVLLDAYTKIPLKGKVYLGHSYGTDTLFVKRKGDFGKELVKETDYEVIGMHPGYVTKRVFISSAGIKDDSTIVVNLLLERANKSQQWVAKNCDSLKKVFKVDNIYYDLDKSFIREDARLPLQRLVRLMEDHPEMTVITASHCDSRASSGYNKALSLRRGAAAKAYLVSKGISPKRISVEYYGKSRLLNSCFDGVPCSEEDQQLNRRTEFDVVLNGVNLTQMDCE